MEGGTRIDQAGLLTRGSQPTFRLPRLFIKPSGIFGSRSPLTVAGPSGIFTRFPFIPGKAGDT